MANNAKNNRRGKTEQSQTTKQDESLTTHLERAEAAVYMSRESTKLLHGQWRQHLKNLSYLLMILTLHQSQSPVTACLKDIKALNEELAEHSRFSAFQAASVILRDSVENICAILMTASLIWFLGMDPPGDFSSRRYMIANSFIPGILTIHFTQPRWPCVNDRLQQVDLEPNPKKDSIPVVLVFHVIVTLSYMFMDWQMRQHEQNVKAVQKLHRELEETEVQVNRKKDK